MVLPADRRRVEGHSPRGEEVHRQSIGSPSCPPAADKPMSPQRHDIPPEEQLSEEAAEWFLRMLSAEPDAEDRYANTTARNAAFREWYSRSPEHVRAFFDICEVDYLSLQLDAEQRAELDAMAVTRKADVIPLYVAPQ